VHYPVKGGSLINVVAISPDNWNEPGWSTPALRRDLLDRFKARSWHGSARDLIRASEQWQKWALFDCRPLSKWGKESVTLLGDAAHAMLPYLAQGAAMAIEDAAVLSESLAHTAGDPVEAARAYERARRSRTARVQRAAHRTGLVYHLGGAAGLIRTFALRRLGGENLLRRYDWLYGWKA
jgi:salicylate hydroxylase